MTKECLFCSDLSEKFVFENDLVFAIRDTYPVSPGHTLIITKRHAETWFDTNQAEQLAVLQALDKIRAELDAEFSPDGYNVGFNAGESAGQTVMHLHVHIIPRFSRDMADPRGGVRGVIPDKQKY